MEGVNGMKGKIYINWKDHKIIFNQEMYDDIRRWYIEEANRSFSMNDFLGEYYSPIEIFELDEADKVKITKEYETYIRGKACKLFSESFKPYEGIVIEDIKAW